MNTRDTAARVRGVLWCAKNRHRTRTRVTRLGNTAGLPVPVLKPRRRACSPHYHPCRVCTFPHLYLPHSPCACLYPALPLYLLALVHTVPAAHFYTLGPARNPRARLMLVCTPPPVHVCPPGARLYPLRSPRTLLLPLPFPLTLRVHPRWLPGSCAPTLCLSFSLWYLTCNRIVSFTVYFVLTFQFGFNIPTKQMNS